jgi:hypothetical protein
VDAREAPKTSPVTYSPVDYPTGDPILGP